MEATSSRMKPLALETDGMSVEEMQAWGNYLVNAQRGINFWLGDLARAAHAKLGDNYAQVFPVDASPGLIQRCEAVAKAYPEADRNPLATWSVHMREANRRDRLERVQAHVDAGRTSDEAAKANRNEARRWMLCVDVHYFLHRFWFSGAGVEAAMGVAKWVQRTVERLKEKGLTDVACCFDSPTNHRKQFDAEYKARPPKDNELIQQLHLVRELLEREGFACVSVDGFEADDVLASFAKRFPGNVTILTQDKDCRQCLSKTTNMLLDVEWSEDETSGEFLPDYKWLSAAQHIDATGIPPGLWAEFQTLMGDACDGVKGAAGIGEKGAADLIREFGTAAKAIEAAKSGDERIKPAKRKALVEFEPKLETTRKLVTLRDDLELPVSTRI